MPRLQATTFLHLLSVAMRRAASLCNGLRHMLSQSRAFTAHRVSILAGDLPINACIMAPALVGLLIAGPGLVWGRAIRSPACGSGFPLACCCC